MRWVIGLLIFTIALNFSTGIIINIIPQFENAASIDTNSEIMGLSYNATYGSQFGNQMQQELKPEGVVEDKTAISFRLMDIINIGILSRFWDTVTDFMFGFVKMLDTMFGSYLIGTDGSMVLHNSIFGALYTLNAAMWIYLAVILWTGRELKLN